MVNQMRNAYQVVADRFVIKKIQTAIDNSGTKGTAGVRNLRGNSGCVLRRTITPSEIRTKAVNVPILIISAKRSSGTMPPSKAATLPMIHVARYGVWNFGWTLEKTEGKRPSLDIAKAIRVCPNSMTSITVSIPTIAPKSIKPATQSCPAYCNASETG